MLSLHFILLLIFFVILNGSYQFQHSLFSNIPDPLEHMYNTSFYKHYGSYLEAMGTATIWSLSTFLQKAGSIFGLLVLVRLLDTRGRKFGAVWLRASMLLLVGILYLLSYFLPSFEAFMAAEFISGAGKEVKWASTVLLLSECAPDEYRGMTVILMQFGQSLATVFSQSLERPSMLGTDESWYLIPAISLVMVPISLLYLSWIPESPKYLAEKKKYLLADKSIEFYHGRGADVAAVMDRIYQEVSDRRELLEGEDSLRIGFKELWRDEALRKATTILIGLYVFFEVSSGAVEHVFYVRIQNMMGLTAETALTISSVSKIVSLPFYCVTAYIVEKMGRRPISICSISLSLVKTVLQMTGLLMAYFSGASQTTQVIGILGVVLNTIMTILGESQIASLLCCEMAPPKARVVVMQTVSLVTMLGGMVFTFLIPYAFNYFPPLPYFFLVLFQPVVMVYIYRNLPETKGRPVSEIVQDFAEAVRSRAPTRRATIVSEEKLPLLQ